MNEIFEGTEDDDTLFRFPKAELHCHLTGCFRLPTIIDLAKKNGVFLPTYDLDELRSFCAITRKKSLADFLRSFAIFTPTFAGNRESLSIITREAIEDKAKQGVRYLELRFTPHAFANCDVSPILHCKERGDLSPRDVIDVICQASAQAQKEFNIEVRLILSCSIRIPEWSMEVARFCKDFSDRGVVGIDIAGPADEEGEKILNHQPAFEFCKDNGIHITVHAGEAGCAGEVQRAMEILNAERIGHGYHVIDDAKIYAEAKKRNTHFEVCPLSSYLTASVPEDLTLHPAIRFMKDQVNFSLSTDDPGTQQSSLFDDYKIALNKFKFSVKEIQELNLNALQSAFCDDTLKQRLIEEFKNAYNLV